MLSWWSGILTNLILASTQWVLIQSERKRKWNAIEEEREKIPNKFHLHLALNPQYSSIYAMKFSKSFPQSVKEQSTVLFLLVYLASHAETFKKFVSLANLTL